MAAPPCPVEYCTDSAGEYLLEVPPLSVNPIYAGFAVCSWDVHVDFGDGTGEDYVFDGAVGLVGSHVFPTRGVTYAVQVGLSNGRSSQPNAFCPPVQLNSSVRYRTEAEEVDPPPPEDEGEPANEPPPWEETEQGGTIPEAVVVSVENTPTPWEGVPQATVPDASAYWRNCRRSVMTHLVSCRKGRRVARLATARLARPGSARVAGFACNRRRATAGTIACRRGARRILTRPAG